MRLGFCATYHGTHNGFLLEPLLCQDNNIWAALRAVFGQRTLLSAEQRAGAGDAEGWRTECRVVAANAIPADEGTYSSKPMPRHNRRLRSCSCVRTSVHETDVSNT